MSQANELIEKAKGTELVGIEQLIDQSIPELTKMLGGDNTAAARFARIVTTDCRMNPDLMECTPLSFMGALFTAAELKLEPVAGHAYLLPFWNSRKVGREWTKFREVSFVLGYRGIVQLFYRHASAMSLSWGLVRQNDEFDYEKGSSSFLKHKPAIKDGGGKIAYWVGAKVNGDFLFNVMSYDDCMEHGRKHSKTYDSKEGKFYKSSPWVKNEDAMCLKTVLIQLAKTLPMSVEMQQAINTDESTRYVDPIKLTGSVIDLPDVTEWNEDREVSDET